MENGETQERSAMKHRRGEAARNGIVGGGIDGSHTVEGEARDSNSHSMSSWILTLQEPPDLVSAPHSLWGTSFALLSFELILIVVRWVFSCFAFGHGGGPRKVNLR